MFGFFTKKSASDLAHNAKNVKRWKSEHIKLQKEAGKVHDIYMKDNPTKAKEGLKRLHLMTMEHLMDEDSTFHSMLREQKDRTEDSEEKQEILAAIEEFRHSFRDTKQVLFRFFTRYSHPDIKLDETFLEEFTGIIDALVARIEFEEKELYSLIDK